MPSGRLSVLPLKCPVSRPAAQNRWPSQRLRTQYAVLSVRSSIYRMLECLTPMCGKSAVLAVLIPRPSSIEMSGHCGWFCGYPHDGPSKLLATLAYISRMAETGSAKRDICARPKGASSGVPTISDFTVPERDHAEGALTNTVAMPAMISALPSI